MLAGTSSGCKTVRGPDGEKALWSSVSTGTAKAKDLKDPIKIQLAYAAWQEQLGQLGEARHAYQAVLEDDSKSVEAILGIARLDQLAGRDQLADNGMQKAIELKPNDPMVQHAVGQYYASKKQYQNAGDLLSKAMMAEPENTVYRYDYAVVLARAGRSEQAMPHFVKTVGEAEAHFNVAYILYQQGQTERAEQHLAESLRQQPNLKPARELMAEVRGVRSDRSALAGTAPQSTGVTQTSMNVPRGAANGSVQPAQRSGRMTMTTQPPRAGSLLQNRIVSPNTPAAPTGYAAPRQPVAQPGSEADYIEQWNNQQ